MGIGMPGGGGAGNGAGAAGIADWNPASGTLGGAGGGVQRGRGTGAASGGSAVPQRVQNPVVAVAAEPQLGHVLSAIAPPHVSLPVWPRSLGARGLACRGRALPRGYGLGSAVKVTRVKGMGETNFSRALAPTRRGPRAAGQPEKMPSMPISSRTRRASDPVAVKLVPAARTAARNSVPQPSSSARAASSPA